MKKLVIIDHFLTDRKGHEEQYDFSIVKAALKRGFQASIWCPPAEIPNQPDFIKQRLRPGFWTSKKMFFPAIASIFEWRRIFNSSDLDENAIVLIQSIRLPILIFLLLGTLGQKIKPRVIIVLRRGLSFMGKLAGLAVRSLNHKGVLFYSDSEIITAELLKRGISGARTLPIPHLPPRQSDPQPKKKLVIGYFGGARYDKGFDLLPLVVERVLAKFSEAKFIIQAYQGRGFSKVKTARDELYRIKNSNSDRINIIDRYISDRDYQDLMSQCSIVLIPARREFYGDGTSGIFAESVANGAWTVVPGRTWMSAQKDKYAKICTFDRYAAAEIFEALVLCIKNMNHGDSEKTRREIEQWYEFHSADRYLDIIFEK